MGAVSQLLSSMSGLYRILSDIVSHSVLSAHPAWSNSSGLSCSGFRLSWISIQLGVDRSKIVHSSVPSGIESPTTGVMDRVPKSNAKEIKAFKKLYLKKYGEKLSDARCRHTTPESVRP